MLCMNASKQARRVKGKVCTNCAALCSHSNDQIARKEQAVLKIRWQRWTGREPWHTPITKEKRWAVLPKRRHLVSSQVRLIPNNTHSRRAFKSHPVRVCYHQSGDDLKIPRGSVPHPPYHTMCGFTSLCLSVHGSQQMTSENKCEQEKNQFATYQKGSRIQFSYTNFYNGKKGQWKKASLKAAYATAPMCKGRTGHVNHVDLHWCS